MWPFRPRECFTPEQFRIIVAAHFAAADDIAHMVYTSQPGNYAERPPIESFFAQADEFIAAGKLK